jgi:tetratricopeptide (TPR) repeat protein
MAQERGVTGLAETGRAAGAAPGKVAVPIAQALETAGKLYLAGQLPRAELICQQVIATKPGMPDAHNMLGVILNARGKAEAAVKSISLAIRLSPSTPSYYSNLGEVERQRGNLDEAQAALAKALELNPQSAEAYSNLGIVHFDRKEFEEAAACYEKAIALQPNFPEAHNNLGNAYRALERRKEAVACYQRAVTQRDGYAEAYNNMAASLRDAQDFESAEHAYRKAINQKPEYIDAYNNLAIMLAGLDRTDDALRLLGDALKLNEKHVPTLLNVARVQLKRGAHDVAEQAATIARGLEPDEAEPYVVLADIQHELDHPEEALRFVERAIELEPEAADVRSFRGVLLKSIGRMDEARAEVRKAIELNPKLYSAYSNLNDLETFGADHDLLAQMEEIMSEAEDPEEERYIPLHFAIAKALEDAGDYPRALDHYQIGAKLRRAQLKYDEADTLGFFDQIMAAFTPETFKNRPFAGNPSAAPVFIVGMPRSGSTLVEQVLQSHPEVFGAGEIKVLNRALGTLRDRFPSIPKYPAMVAAMEPAHFEQVADFYLTEVFRRAGDATRVTDKLLTNFFFVGLIQLLFPKAKIIHTRRNPVDTCLSAFTKLFKDDMPHSYDFGELGHYYRKYEEVMAHWEQVLPPGVMMTVDYEDTVGDLERVARGLVDHIGLPWNDACLAFHTSKRAVKTASVVQVRQPVYKTSVERFRRYGDGLAPLLDALHYPRPDERGQAGSGGARAGRLAAAPQTGKAAKARTDNAGAARAKTARAKTAKPGTTSATPAGAKTGKAAAEPKTAARATTGAKRDASSAKRKPVKAGSRAR